MKVGVIVNEKSGPDISNPEKIEEEFKKYDFEVITKITTGKDLEEQVAELIDESVDIIAVSGGDGTISGVVERIIGYDFPLGILPGGTFNNFAKDTGIPLNLEDAVKLIVNSKPHQIDVGEVNGKIFINNSSVGLYPRAVKIREKILHKLGGKKWAAMFIALITIFKRFPLFKVVVKTEQEIENITTPFVFIGNNEYKFEMFNLGRRTNFTAGKLNLYTANITKRFEILKLILLNIFNRLDQDKNFSLQLVENVTLETNNRTVNVAIDGEIVKLKPPLKYKILHKKLKVFLTSNKI